MNWIDTRKTLIDKGQPLELPLEWEPNINLHEADLHGADLRWANLSGANLSEADLRWANLSEANLSEADLRWANLSEADLHGADLHGANLSEADLHGADLRGAKWDYTTVGLAPAPEGTLIVWGKKSGHILKFRINEDVPRSCATSRKHRSASVSTLAIDDGAVETFVHHTKYGDTVYAVDQVTEADSWDDDRWNECSHGIHWFLSRHEAEQWGN